MGRGTSKHLEFKGLRVFIWSGRHVWILIDVIAGYGEEGADARSSRGPEARCCMNKSRSSYLMNTRTSEQASDPSARPAMKSSKYDLTQACLLNNILSVGVYVHWFRSGDNLLKC